MKTPKGTPTSLNLFTLAGHFRGLDVASNRITATQRNGLARCLRAGLLTVDVKRGALNLTDLGRDALCGYAFDLGASPYGWQGQTFLFKKCSTCGAEMNRAQWDALPLVGYQPQFTEAGDPDTTCTLELRNCSCRTTLSVEVPLASPEVLP